MSSESKHCAKCSRPVGRLQPNICRPYKYEKIKGEEVPVCMDKASCKIAEMNRLTVVQGD